MSRPKKAETDEAFRAKGLIVSMGDAAAFTNAIIRLDENPNERSKLGMAAREFDVKDLGRKKILSRFTEVLNSFQKNKFRQDSPDQNDE